MTMATPPPVEHCGDIHASKAISGKYWNVATDASVIALFLYGSWDARQVDLVSLGRHGYPRWTELFDHDNISMVRARKQYRWKSASVKVDEDDESMNTCVKKVSNGGLGSPGDLPALVILRTGSSTDGLRVEHVPFNGAPLKSLLLLMQPSSWTPHHSDGLEILCHEVASAIERVFIDTEPKGDADISSSHISRKRKVNEPATRLFVAGDRSQVGKSSICLGLLGALLNSDKYVPSDLAYIKPATQCEQTQLVEEFCKHKGITACVPIGPIVYYKGFTRAFLKGEIPETSEQMLQNAADAVDNLALKKKVVIIDGVGYPAVGSITGTDNASVAKACGKSFSLTKSRGTARSPVPVLLIGKSGVGDAVDSFNINATYFTHRNVPVIGALFNKLSLDGFYSLKNCKEAIDMYFHQYQPERTAFGYIPEIPSLKNAREHVANASKEDQLKQSLDMADLFVNEFSKHVNVDLIIKGAKDATEKYIADHSSNPLTSDSAPKRPSCEIESISNASNSKRQNVSASGIGFPLTRDQIEAAASAAGAAGG